jgi:hypothetical protein
MTTRGWATVASWNVKIFHHRKRYEMKRSYRRHRDKVKRDSSLLESFDYNDNSFVSSLA